MRASAVALAALLLLPGLARAQQPDASAAPTAFSCADPYSAALTWTSDFTFQRLPARPSLGDLPASVRPVVFGPFDARRYGFERVEFYPHAVLPPAEQYGDFETNTELRLYVHLLAPGGESWWMLQGKEDGSLAAETSHFALDEDGQHASFSDDPAALAAPDAALPLFRLAFSSRSTGASTVATQQTQLLVDLRSGAPQANIQLLCSEVDGGGVCGAPDHANGPRAVTQCDWQPGRQDYLCRSTAGAARNSYYLLSRQDAYVPPAGQPRTPAEFAQWMEKDHGWRKRAPVLEGYGEVRALARLHDGAQVRYLLGAPGAEHIARFLLVTLRPGAEPPAQQLQVRVLDEDPDSPPAAAPQPDFSPDVFPTGPAVSFHLRGLAGEHGLALWQITATQGELHAVYWVGIDEPGSALTAEALEISTDVSAYSHCGLSRQPAAAYAVRLDKDPFRASLTIEPGVYTDEDDRYTDGGLENASPRCPQLAQVAWQPGQGFVVQDVSGSCAAPELPHRVVISTDGRLSRLAPVITPPPPAKK